MKNVSDSYSLLEGADAAWLSIYAKDRSDKGISCLMRARYRFIGRP